MTATPSDAPQLPRQSQKSTQALPNIHLLCMLPSGITAWNNAIASQFPELPTHTTITEHTCSLKNLSHEIAFDAIVSPANSFARLDGAFDDAIACEYGPKTDYEWITRVAQKIVYEKWRGFAPPGTCTIVPIPAAEPDQYSASNINSRHPPDGRPWQSRYLLLCPTMKVPLDVNWDREVVYECIWSMLCAIDQHNVAVREGRADHEGATEISSILMTPLATGVGKLRPQRWAEQCVLAMKQWVDAVERPEVWGHMEWEDIYRKHWQVEQTFKDDL